MVVREKIVYSDPFFCDDCKTLRSFGVCPNSTGEKGTLTNCGPTPPNSAPFTPYKVNPPTRSVLYTAPCGLRISHTFSTTDEVLLGQDEKPLTTLPQGAHPEVWEDLPRASIGAIKDNFVYWLNPVTGHLTRTSVFHFNK